MLRLIFSKGANLPSDLPQRSYIRTATKPKTIIFLKTNNYRHEYRGKSPDRNFIISMHCSDNTLFRIAPQPAAARRVADQSIGAIPRRVRGDRLQDQGRRRDRVRADEPEPQTLPRQRPGEGTSEVSGRSGHQTAPASDGGKPAPVNAAVQSKSSCAAVASPSPASAGRRVRFPRSRSPGPRPAFDPFVTVAAQFSALAFASGMAPG